MIAPPLTFQWDGEAMRPYDPSRADEIYVVGERYRLVEYEPPSTATRGHYFACIKEAWGNLPDHLVERFPTTEHLRKYALIKAGYHDSRSLAAASKAEAQRIAAFVRPSDEFAIVVMREATVTIFIAKSQSLKAMGKKDFQESKQAVLDILAGMIGTDSETLARQGKNAA